MKFTTTLTVLAVYGSAVYAQSDAPFWRGNGRCSIVCAQGASCVSTQEDAANLCVRSCDAGNPCASTCQRAGFNHGYCPTNHGTAPCICTLFQI
ncbi:hypothetical protein J1614_011012 [Plenodomus biglobosus]|nr:hypothetical protein J1614_011012 [Plenodomus biglobosus]